MQDQPGFSKDTVEGVSDQSSTAVVRVQDMFDEATRSREEAEQRRKEQEQYDKDAQECLETQRRRVAEKDIYKKEYTESDRGGMTTRSRPDLNQNPRERSRGCQRYWQNFQNRQGCQHQKIRKGNYETEV